MSKIKIAEIITRLDWGGSPDIIRILCQSLNRDKYEVKLIAGMTRYPTDKTRKFLEEFKDNFISVPCLRREINPFFDALALFKLCRILAKEEFDIVHTHTAKAGALGRLAAHFSGSRRIIHMPHGNNFYGYFNYFTSKLVILAERILSRYTSLFVALSNLEKRELIEYAVAPEEKIRVVNSGLDLEFKNIGQDDAFLRKRSFGFDSNQRVVGMVSRLEPIKGPEYFIESIPQIIKKSIDTAFLVVGEGSLRKKLEKRAKELGLKDRITFLGWREDILKIIAFLDILVQPSLNEAIGRVLLEAQGLGIPVVATSVGGIPEIVRDGVTGILVPPKDSERLAEAVSGLLLDEEKRSGMSRKSKEWVDEKFSAQRMLKDIDTIYQEIVSI